VKCLITFLVGALLSILLLTYLPLPSEPEPEMYIVTMAWLNGDVTMARALDCGLNAGALYFTALDEPKGFAVIPLLGLSYAVCTPIGDHIGQYPTSEEPTTIDLTDFVRP